MKHADSFTIGVVDVSAWLPGKGNIWIETKAKDLWPKRLDTLVVLEKEEIRWTLQREFLEKRRGWLFARIEREYLLFNYSVLSQINHVAQDALRRAAFQIWKQQVDWEEFARCLSSN